MNYKIFDFVFDIDLYDFLFSESTETTYRITLFSKKTGAEVINHYFSKKNPKETEMYFNAKRNILNYLKPVDLCQDFGESKPDNYLANKS